MKQLFQHLSNGTLEILEVPCPEPTAGRLVIQAQVSLISAGTERMLLDFGRGSWLQKVKSQPDKVRQVRQKIMSDGLIPTLRAVRRKLAVPIPLGYSQVGKVLAVGPGVLGFEAGDLVLSNGNHAEVVSVPVNLCAKVPAGLKAEEACFGVVGAIGLQGIRLVAPTMGERIGVIGLGLIGQLTVQLLRAQGCEVLAIDLDPDKVQLAERCGASGCVVAPGVDPVAAAIAFSQGRGLDAVIIAAATSSSGPLVQAAGMCRQRGRIVLVGVVAIQVPRDLFYKKELSFQVSCSYGPGRYDHAYEEQGQDYPLAFVRWTEQRNFEAVLAQLAAGRVQVAPLISHRVPFDEAERAYATLLKDRTALGILLEYPQQTSVERTITVGSRQPLAGIAGSQPGIALIGSGQYTLATLLPALDQAPAHRRVALVSRQGVSAALAAKQYHFSQASTQVDEVLAHPGVDAVIITTRHDSHADLVVRALEAGKHVFVEKPLATTLAEVDRIQQAMASHPDVSVTVGFNRPWSPMFKRIKESMRSRKGAVQLIAEINAGALPPDHWLLGPEGGGRLIGEGCHFIHLMRDLVGSPLTGAHTDWIKHTDGIRTDSFTTTLRFADGSLATVIYNANGHKTYPKETYTLYWEGKVARMTNFQKAEGWGAPVKAKSWSQDKGHAELMAAWIAGLGKTRIQDPEILLEVSRMTILANQ